MNATTTDTAVKDDVPRGKIGGTAIVALVIGGSVFGALNGPLGFITKQLTGRDWAGLVVATALGAAGALLHQIAIQSSPDALKEGPVDDFAKKFLPTKLYEFIFEPQKVVDEIRQRLDRGKSTSLPNL